MSSEACQSPLKRCYSAALAVVTCQSSRRRHANLLAHNLPVRWLHCVLARIRVVCSLHRPGLFVSFSTCTSSPSPPPPFGRQLFYRARNKHIYCVPWWADILSLALSLSLLPKLYVSRFACEVGRAYAASCPRSVLSKRAAATLSAHHDEYSDAGIVSWCIFTSFMARAHQVQRTEQNITHGTVV